MPNRTTTKSTRSPAKPNGAATPADASTNAKIIDLLIKSYNDEIETVMNYLANSVNLDGVRAKHIKAALEADIEEELGHARTLARRIKTIGGSVPGSQSLTWTQKKLQPPKKSTDVVAVIKGVIAAEEEAIAGYQEIIEVTDGVDFVTQDMVIALQGDEQEHRREFIGFLKEYEQA